MWKVLNVVQFNRFYPPLVYMHSAGMCQCHAREEHSVFPTTIWKLLDAISAQKVTNDMDIKCFNWTNGSELLTNIII